MPTGRARRAVGPPADVFGLGATLHHALAGAPPFPRGAARADSRDPEVRFPQLVRGAGAAAAARAGAARRARAALPRARPRRAAGRGRGRRGARAARGRAAAADGADAPLDGRRGRQDLAGRPRAVRGAPPAPVAALARDVGGARPGSAQAWPPLAAATRDDAGGRRPTPPRPCGRAACRAGSGRRSRSRARPARPSPSSKPGCSAAAMIRPISTKSSTCSAAGGERRRPDAQAGRDRRRPRVERDRVAVDGDADVVQPVLGLRPSSSESRRSTSTRCTSVPPVSTLTPCAGLAEQLVGHRPGARERALLALAERARRPAILQRHGLAGDDVLERAALLAGEHRGVDLLRVLLAAQDQPAAGAAERLVDGRGRRRPRTGTGLGCRPAATSPAKCAMSTIRSAPTSSAIARKRSKSRMRG